MGGISENLANYPWHLGYRILCSNKISSKCAVVENKERDWTHPKARGESGHLSSRSSTPMKKDFNFSNSKLISTPGIFNTNQHKMA